MHDKIKKQLQQYYMQNFTHTHTHTHAQYRK